MNVLNRIGSFFGDIARANSAVRNYQRLDAMSDRALAARGLKRDELASVVYAVAFAKAGD
jgi:hypothetical protein